MKSPNFRGLCVTAATLTVGIAATLMVQHVRAAGIPSTTAFTYSGMLSLPDGTLVNGSKNIGLAVYEALSGGSPACQVMSGPVIVTGGHFQIALPDTCVAAVKANPDLWVELQVDGAPIIRTKLGAVPYAVEAGRAVSAATAASATEATRASAATGALEQRIAALETDVTALESRRKLYSGQVSFTNGNCATIATACTIDLTDGAFTAAPNCAITLRNVDNTGYTEHMVIQSVTATTLKVWRGQYYQPNGTTMDVHFLCAGI